MTIRTPDKERPRYRGIVYSWSIGQSTQDPADIDWGELTVDHNTDRKRYEADLSVHAVDPRGGKKFLIGAGIVIRLPALPAPRYNAKTLAQFAKDTLENLEALCAALPVDNERRVQVWNQARELLENLQSET